jgi:hypothetical protein
MAGLSLRQAADEAGTSKSTILRAIQSGRLSAARTDNGGYSIDPSELFRVYPPKSSVASAQPVERSEGQSATGDAMHGAIEVRVRNAQLEAEINALKATLEAERKRAEELRDERDRWATQAERLALPRPASTRSGWWPFRRAS